MTEKLSIIPPTGAVEGIWINSPNLTQGKSGGISAAGWTYGNEGFIQQTFLGASIRSFNLVAGFGDTNSSLSIQLINDEYNTSDKTGLGIGDDVYHNGKHDMFAPPPVGTPVFFKFGKNHSTVEQAWRRLFDVTYRMETIPKESLLEKPAISSSPENAIEKRYVYDIERKGWVDLSDSRADDDKEYAGDGVEKFFSRGKDHLVFGGILQSYTQNKGPDGNPLYSVNVVDPREILSNVQIILNNYTGSMFGNKNFVNVYGFLEYDVSDELNLEIEESKVLGYSLSPIDDPNLWTTVLPYGKIKESNNIEKVVFPNGEMQYFGTDMHYLNSEFLPRFLPMTGEGFSRRSDQGIPWYRVRQAINALFEYDYELPTEYKQKGFGSQIDFRGFNYVVDFSGIPIEKIPQMYFLDFDQIDLLSLAQEICEVISHDLYITLLPVINHPACSALYQRNQTYINNKEFNKIIAGIIRIEAIDRSAAPEIGAIKTYIEVLKQQKNINVENQDLGYELANITTDKIVAGAQTVDIHFFSNNKDRDELYLRMKKAKDELGAYEYEKIQQEQWTLETSLKQQILPFYGFIGKNVPTIPRGFGPYQQILLDATGLDADGVGNYYIATEMELRAAMISYEQWARFLLQYNETYIEEIGDNSIFYRELQSSLVDDGKPNGMPEPGDTDNITNTESPWLNREFGVTVPRSVFMSEKNYMGPDGYPASPCSPPFGYPLYYKRAEKIGVPEAGVIKYQNAIVEIVTNYEKLAKEAKKRDELLIIQQDAADKFLKTANKFSSKFLYGTVPIDEAYKLMIQGVEALQAVKDVESAEAIQENVVKIRQFIEGNSEVIKKVNRLAKKHLKNAKKVYEFVKNIAEQNLGKKFLVKIPKATNLFYSSIIEEWPQTKDGNVYNYQYGPFGFEPEITLTDTNIYFSKENKQKYLDDLLVTKRSKFKYYNSYFNFNSFDIDNGKIIPSKDQYFYGGLKVNFNPVSDNWEFNYKPENQGGFFKNEIFPVNLSYDTLLLPGYNVVTPGQQQLLIPMDLSNFESNGRISAYVRYDHSENLDLSSVGVDNLHQQRIDGNIFIPDPSEELNNVTIDTTLTLDQISERINKNGAKKDNHVAFVKCEVDDQLYLLPKISEMFTLVFGRETKYIPNAMPLKMIEIIDENGCKKMVPGKPYSLPIFTLDENGGSTNVKAKIFEFNRVLNPIFDSNMIDTNKTNLSSDHVYAIITIPGRVIPTVDFRYHDGPYQAINGVDLKHLLTQDTVSPAPFKFKFDKPKPIQGKEEPIDCSKFTFTQLTNAQKVQKATLQNIGFADPKINIGFSQPSPVYPSLVAIPLLSREKCYGPWFSSSILNGYSNNGLRYKNIGGKVEFVKDENLAPWNYAGYQLLNEAGAIQAQFSNSLLLFSERGGISYPDAPNGVDLAKPLQFGGPLITSISVDINESSVKTTIKMDLYTSRFGKLSKQREAVISQVIREKQKLIDQKNYAIRRGFNKGKSNNDILSTIRADGQKLINQAQATTSAYNDIEMNKSLPSNIIVGLQQSSETVNQVGSNAQLNSTSVTQVASIQNPDTMNERMEILANEGDQNTLNKTYNETAGVSLSEFVVGYNTCPIGSQNSSNFAAKQYPSSKYLEKRYNP